MANMSGPGGNAGHPSIYRIRIKGHLGRRWAERFAGLEITPEDDGTTLLTGPIADQAALHGVLRKIRDLGLELLSLNPVAAGPGQAAETDRPEGGA